jgi:hypothetical protein
MGKIREPRDKGALMQSDWYNVLCTLKMLQDRALTGTWLHIKRPDWYPKNGAYDQMQRDAAKGMIDDIFSTVVVDEPEEADAQS